MQPFKVCPQCQSPADLAAPQCLNCGRIYRTQFQPPPPSDQTIMMGAPVPDTTVNAFTPTQEKKKLHPAILVTCILVAICAGMLIINNLQLWGVEILAIKGASDAAKAEQERQSQAKQELIDRREWAQHLMQGSKTNDGIPPPNPMLGNR